MRATSPASSSMLRFRHVFCTCLHQKSYNIHPEIRAINPKSLHPMPEILQLILHPTPVKLAILLAVAQKSGIDFRFGH